MLLHGLFWPKHSCGPWSLVESRIIWFIGWHESSAFGHFYSCQHWSLNASYIASPLKKENELSYFKTANNQKQLRHYKNTFDVDCLLLLAGWCLFLTLFRKQWQLSAPYRAVSFIKYNQSLCWNVSDVRMLMGAHLLRMWWFHAQFSLWIWV